MLQVCILLRFLAYFVTCAIRTRQEVLFQGVELERLGIPGEHGSIHSAHSSNLPLSPCRLLTGSLESGFVAYLQPH
jgi:hypothetical protein